MDKLCFYYILFNLLNFSLRFKAVISCSSILNCNHNILKCPCCHEISKALSSIAKLIGIALVFSLFILSLGQNDNFSNNFNGFNREEVSVKDTVFESRHIMFTPLPIYMEAMVAEWQHSHLPPLRPGFGSRHGLK